MPGRGGCATASVIVEEVATATAEAIACSSNATISGHSIAQALDITVGNCANDFTQNSEALPLQIALHATIKTARSFYAS